MPSYDQDFIGPIASRDIRAHYDRVSAQVIVGGRPPVIEKPAPPHVVMARQRRIGPITASCNAAADTISHDASVEDRARAAFNLAKALIAENPAMSRIYLIKRATACCFGVDIDKMVAPGRKQAFVQPRQIAMTIAKAISGHPHHFISSRFNRDHATTSHAITKYGAMIEKISGQSLLLTDMHACGGERHRRNGQFVSLLIPIDSGMQAAA